MKNKLLILFFILFFIFTTSVFASNSNVDIINSDVYTVEDDFYSLDSTISGNVFVYSDEFEMLNTASIEGNLYVTCKKAQIKSDVTYSKTISKDGSYSIESVNSYAVVNGNAFIICDEFILEPGAEINGDLYIIAKKIDIQKSSSIYGNLFASSEEILLDGRVSNSVYAISDNFNMSYYGSISKDLHLNSENVTLNSVIHRNAYISSKVITTNQDFLLYGNLESNSHQFNFSGQIDGDAKINSKELNFLNNNEEDDSKCLISGNLSYSTKEEMQIGNDIVIGDINYSNYIEKIDKTLSYYFKSFAIDLIAFIIYVLAIILLFKLINKNYIAEKHQITVKNILLSVGIGIISLLAVILISIFLIFTKIGLLLGIVFIFAYLFLLLISIPLLILDIASLFSNRLNLYIAISLITLALYLISLIPIVGSIMMFIVILTGVGRVVNKIFIDK